MKKLLLALAVILFCPGFLWADNLLQNGDFSAGDAHWQGDGQTPGAYAQANPPALNDPLMSKGLIVPLKPTAWTRIFQSFPSGAGTQFSIVATYMFGPNFALSKNADDYAEISKRLQIPGFENFGSIGVKPGQFYGTIGDPSSPTIAMEVFSPRQIAGKILTYMHTYPPIPATATKIVALAFPPGTGTVTVLTVTVTSN